METFSICCGVIFWPLLFFGWLAGCRVAGFSKKVRNIGLVLICVLPTLAVIGMGWSFFVVDPFMDACSKGDLPAVKSYLAKGVSPNTTDEFDRTALGSAIGAGQDEVALYLLDHGADPNQETSGDTPLLLAKKMGMPKVIEALKRKGAR